MTPGQNSALFVLGAALVLVSAASCSREEPNPFPPDTVLRDSLGLTEADRVHRIRLASGPEGEIVDPAVVELESGAYLEFYTQDRRVRTVSFRLEELSLEQADFLSSTGQESSPPLVELDSRFLVSFQDAPPGRYPFTVQGNGPPLEGLVVVAYDPSG